MFRLTSSSSHIPARRATSPAEGNSRAIAGHNRTIPRTRQHIKPRPGGFIAIHRALCCISFVSMIRALPCIYRSKRKPCRFACTATALAFTPSSIAFAAIWSLNVSTGRSVSRKLILVYFDVERIQAGQQLLIATWILVLEELHGTRHTRLDGRLLIGLADRNAQHRVRVFGQIQ